MSVDNDFQQDQERRQAEDEFNLLKTDPHAFAQKFNGRLPSIAHRLAIPKEGFVVDESALRLPEWQLVHGMMVPLRISDSDTIYTRGLAEQLQTTRQNESARAFVTVVNTKIGYPEEFILGIMLPEDLTKTAKLLKKQFDKIFSTFSRDHATRFITGSAKIRAIFAILPYDERDKAPDYSQVHI